MGILGRLKQAALIGLELDPPSQNIPPVALGEDAWTAEAVAALPPGSGRAVVQSSEGAAGEEGVSLNWKSYDLTEWILRLRLPGGGFGPRESRWVTVPRVFSETIGSGDEVPVTVNPDGSLDKVDLKALKAEGPPREPPARKGLFNPVGDVAALREAGTSLMGHVRGEGRAGPQPTASTEPVDGVSFELWVECEAATSARKPGPSVPDAARAEWRSRVAADQQLRKRYASALPAAIKRITLG